MVVEKIKPLNQNSDKVIELLNENKHNLMSLVMQQNNIIELYLELLGCGNWSRPNSNEVVLPEIIKLLEVLDYDCKFTKVGIYQDREAIFTGTKNKISITNGKNKTNLLKRIINNNLNGVFVQKDITDFSRMDKDEMCFLSSSAYRQMHSTEESCNLVLTKISICTSISEGIELSKIVTEDYYSKIRPNESVTITSTIYCNTDEPTILCKRKNMVSKNIREDDEKYLRFCFMGDNPPIDNFTKENKFFCYGDTKLNLNYEDKYNDNSYKCNHYDDERLVKTLKTYLNKYPNSYHPMLTHTYENVRKSDLGKKAYKKFLDYYFSKYEQKIQ